MITIKNEGSLIPAPPPHVYTLRAEVTEIEAEIAALYEKKRAITKAAQAVCPHVDYFEARHNPPFRVCILCGYSEEGWHAGYWKLGPKDYDAPTVSEARCRRLQIGAMMTQSMMYELRYGRK